MVASELWLTPYSFLTTASFLCSSERIIHTLSPGPDFPTFFSTLHGTSCLSVFTEASLFQDQLSQPVFSSQCSPYGTLNSWSPVGMAEHILSLLNTSFLTLIS